MSPQYTFALEHRGSGGEKGRSAVVHLQWSSGSVDPVVPRGSSGVAVMYLLAGGGRIVYEESFAGDRSSFSTCLPLCTNWSLWADWSNWSLWANSSTWSLWADWSNWFLLSICSVHPCYSLWANMSNYSLWANWSNWSLFSVCSIYPCYSLWAD